MKTILTINLPEYILSPDCDFDDCGSMVDRLIEEYFSQEPIVIRAIGLCEHGGLTLDELVNKVLDTGTDKYDNDRISIFEEDFNSYQFDFHGCAYRFVKGKLKSFSPDNCQSEMGSTFRAFYEHAPTDRGYPVRIDLILIYKLKFLEHIEPMNDDISDYEKLLVSYLFRFINQKEKLSALSGIIRIL